ncbi:MAG: hypothetical protein ACTSXV_02200 [Alphaproteobacteria bacterium]
MKKISLLTLAVATGFAFATPAQAMNTENPLYMPKAGNIFMVGEMNYSNLEIKSNDSDPGTVSVVQNDDFQNGDWDDSFLIGYGFTDKFAVTVTTETPTYMNTNFSMYDDREASPVISGIFRAVKNGNVVLDVIGSFNPALQYNEAMTLGAGIRAGVITKSMTLAFGGYVGYGMSYDHINTATGNDDNFEVDDNMSYTLTGDLQLNFSNNMSLNINGEYFLIDEQEAGSASGSAKLGEVEGFRLEMGLSFEMKKKMLITPYLAYVDLEQDDLDGNDSASTSGALDGDGVEVTGMEYGIRFGMEF